MKKKMTVKELIEELQKYPEDAEVRMCYWGHDDYWDQWFDACVEPYVKFEEDFRFDNWAWAFETKDLVLICD